MMPYREQEERVVMWNPDAPRVEGYEGMQVRYLPNTRLRGVKQFRGVRDVFDFVVRMGMLEDTRERMYAIYCDQRNKPVGYYLIGSGTPTNLLVHPVTVFGPAVALQAVSLFLVHNHPSGNLTASLDDRNLCARLERTAMEMLGIRLVDFVIVSREGAVGLISHERIDAGGLVERGVTGAFDVASNPGEREQALFWGRQASGMLFRCPAERRYLLTLRSANVMDPGVWGIPGGACGGDGVFAADERDPGPKLDLDVLWQCAVKEVEEELGWFPPYVKKHSAVVFKKSSFRYVTFVVDISAAEQRRSLDSITLNWESDDFAWLSRGEVAQLDRQGLLHPGVSYVFDREV